MNSPAGRSANRANSASSSNSAAAAARQEALAALLADVQREPWAHDFFVLMRRIDALRPQMPRTGQASRPVQEALRLGQPPELDFAPAPIASLEPRGDGPARLAVRFFGLLGPQGPMPLHITEYARERLRQHGDPTLVRFLDLFHHRLLSLFHRAWAQAQPVVHADRPADDRYGAWLSAAAGLPLPAVGSLPAAALAFHAGHLGARTRHPEAMRKVLQQHFGVEVWIEEHVGSWLPIAACDRTLLGHAPNRAERSVEPPAALGRNANLGSRAWDRQSGFRLRLGALTRPQYRSFLPGGDAWRPLVDWVGVLAGRELRWDLQLELRSDQRPEPRPSAAIQLGLTTWLGRRPARHGAPPLLLRLRPATTFLHRRTGATDG